LDFEVDATKVNTVEGWRDLIRALYSMMFALNESGGIPRFAGAGNGEEDFKFLE